MGLEVIACYCKMKDGMPDSLRVTTSVFPFADKPGSEGAREVLMEKRPRSASAYCMAAWLLIAGGCGLVSNALAVTFGETTPSGFGTSNLKGVIIGYTFTCGANGNVNRLYMYITSGSQNGRMAIYDGSLNLLAESASQVVTAGWNEFPIPTTAVSDGADYFLAFQVDNAATNIGSLSDTVAYRGQSWSYGTFSSTLSLNVVDSVRFCLYATEILPTATPTATPILSATPSLTRTPSSTQTPSATPTRTPLLSPTATRTRTGTHTPTSTATLSRTPTATASMTPTHTPLPTASGTMFPSCTPTFTCTPALTALAAAEEIQVYPNPFRPGRAVGHTLKITGLASSDKITLYTLNGEKVFAADGVASRLEWDGKNLQGSPAAAGYYFWTVERADGQTVRGKILIKE